MMSHVVLPGQVHTRKCVLIGIYSNYKWEFQFQRVQTRASHVIAAVLQERSARINE